MTIIFVGEDCYVTLGKRPKDFKKHFWALDVAIEHENDSTDWMDEVVKLSYINCPLRIVVGYAPKENRDDYLAYVSNALRILNQKYQCVRENQEFMLILGDSGMEGKDVSIDNYTPYIYRLNGDTSEAFEPMINRKRE